MQPYIRIYTCSRQSTENPLHAGTGKSVTGAHLAYGFVYCNRSKPLATRDGRIKCVMVCGPSNKSVDVVLGRNTIYLRS